MKTFYIKAVGVSYENRQRIIAKLKPGDVLYFVLEPGNKYDRFAIRIVNVLGEEVGHVSRAYNEDIFRNIQNGYRYNLTVSDVTGGGRYIYGVNIRVDCEEKKENIAYSKQDSYDEAFDNYSLSDYVNDNFGGDWSYYENQMDD